MRLPNPAELLALATLAILVALPFHPTASEVESDQVFEISMASSASGELKLYFDDGNGLREALAAASPVAAGTELVRHRLRIPGTTLRAIRVDPVNAPATISIENARVIRSDGTVVRSFAPEAFTPTYEIDAVSVHGARLDITTTPGGIDPQLTLALNPPLAPVISGATPFGITLRRVLVVFAVAALFWHLLAGSRHAGRLRSAIGRFATDHPGRLVALIAVAAAIASSYPVVFLGRSYVSPNYADGTILLYPTFPTLPGYEETKTEHAKGSDVGPMAWAHGPAAMVEHEALFEHGEIPLWNRYNSGGVDLLGQGQLMVGDPLHLLVIAADGAAWAWDMKYVLAKFLFALALGLVVLASTQHAPAAWLTALSAPFIGFFIHRANHPAFFSLCYAPLILLAWLRIVRARDRRAVVPWMLLLVLANFMEMTSGTAKEAYMLIACMNLAGVLVLGVAPLSWAERLWRLGVVVAAGVLFVFMTAPLWVTFLNSLKTAYTAYNAPSAYQIHPALLLGLFDELFYRPFHMENRVWNPSASFLVMAGVLYVAATWRRAAADRVRTALVLACLPPFALAFGVIPPGWIVRVPFLANVAHVDNTFSCVLIVLGIVLAGFGWKIAAARLGTQEGRGDLAGCSLLLGALIVPWIAFDHVIHREPFGGNTFLPIKHDGLWGPTDPFVWMNLVGLVTSSLVLAFVVRSALRRGSWSPAGVIVGATCLAVLLWRFGAHAPSRFDDFVYNPPVRVDLHARSEAVEFIRSHRTEPGRVAGLENVMMPGWSAAYKLEGISGPDALVNPFYRELTGASGIERLWDWRLVVHPETLLSLQRIYDMLNVRYFLATSRPLDIPSDRLVTRLTADLVVLESPTVWPRAFFTDRVAAVRTVPEIIALVRDGDGRPFAAALPTEAAMLGLPEELANRTVVPAREYRLTPNTTTFEIDTPTAGLVVLHETWQPGSFRVTVDGRRATCLQMNGAFKAVKIDQPGRHVIRFECRPRHFDLALLASAFGSAGLVALAWLLRRRPGAARVKPSVSISQAQS